MVLMLLILSASTYAQRRPKDKILDRKVFVIHLEEVSTKKKKKAAEPVESELSFRSNRLVARYMQSPDGGGFQAGDYVIYEKEDVLMKNATSLRGSIKTPKACL